MLVSLRNHMGDCFEQIHKLLRQHKYSYAFKLLIDEKKGRIKSPFNSDINHSWYLVGDILYTAKKYTQALIAFKKSLRNWPEDYQAMCAIANCYSDLNKPKLAQRFLLKAIRVAGRKDELVYNLGNALFDQKKYEAAALEYKKVSKKNKMVYKLAIKNLKKCEATKKQGVKKQGVTS